MYVCIYIYIYTLYIVLPVRRAAASRGPPREQYPKYQLY